MERPNLEKYLHHRRFTQCNWCAELKAKLKHAADPEDPFYYKRCLNDHYKWKTAPEEEMKKLLTPQKTEVCGTPCEAQNAKRA